MLEGQKCLVIGSGISGIGAVALLEKYHADVVLYDSSDKLTKEDLEAKLPGESKAVCIAGELPEEVELSIQAAVLSPGVPTDIPLVNRMRDRGVQILGEIELGFLAEQGRVIAITGTNGKTTTTTLTGEIMKAHFGAEKTFVVGNIGNPYTLEVTKTSKDSVTVGEISSFQLETIHTFHPVVSAILNITPDHLNRHYTFENYANCKLDITKNQTKEDYAVMNYDDPETVKRIDKVPATVILFSHKKELESGVIVKDGAVVIRENGKETYVMPLSEFQLLGDHNIENLLAAVAISYYMGADIATIRKVCGAFKGVAHRIEYVRTLNDVNYYNDSKGTNPDAAIKAIQSMVRPTYLIGGGYDKKSTYDEWIESFDGKVKCLLLIGQTAQDIADCARKHGFENIEMMDDLKQVVEYCHTHAQPGDAVLLSPACASWGMFDNYEQRGDMFKEYVNALS